MTITPFNDTVRFKDASGNVQDADVVVAISLDATGVPATALPAGRASSSASVPTVLSNEDKLALYRAGGAYRRATAVGATAGDAVLVTGVTTAGTVTLTLAGGGSVSISVPLGSSILPFAAIAAALGTAAGGTFQSLFTS